MAFATDHLSFEAKNFCFETFEKKILEALSTVMTPEKFWRLFGVAQLSCKVQIKNFQNCSTRLQRDFLAIWIAIGNSLNSICLSNWNHWKPSNGLRSKTISSPWERFYWISFWDWQTAGRQRCQTEMDNLKGLILKPALHCGEAGGLEVKARQLKCPRL